MITLVMNGKKVTTEPGRTVLEVAREVGIEIPLCLGQGIPPELLTEGIGQHKGHHGFSDDGGRRHSTNVTPLHRSKGDLP